jgi:CheY-like chemotaxis protein
MTGLRLAHETSPEVIFHDIAMPVMNGYSAVAELRKHEKFATTRIIAVTAYGTDADRERALRCGFDVHLAKPADIRDIQQVLDR